MQIANKTGKVQRLDSLDFLRGLAVLAVVTFHLFIIQNVNNSFISSIIRQGYLGVQLFFLVSAVTMCLMWEKRRNEPLPVLKFYIRRLFRIVPPFWLAILFYYFIGGEDPGFAPEGIRFRHIFITGILLHTFWPDTINSVVPGGWSIGVEVAFYTVFPLLVGALARRPTFFIFAGLVIFMINLSLIEPMYRLILQSFPYKNLIQAFLYMQFFTQAPVFLIGMFVYRSVFVDRQPIILAFLLGLGWLITAFVLKTQFGIDSRPFFWLAVFSLAAVVFCALVFQISWAPIVFLGRCSYSIYLIHFAIINLILYVLQVESFDLEATTTFALALLITVALSTLAGFILSSTVERFSAELAISLIRKISYKVAA